MFSLQKQASFKVYPIFPIKQIIIDSAGPVLPSKGKSITYIEIAQQMAWLSVKYFIS